MTRKLKIAITGGIGSGKSTAIAHIKKLGYPVFSSDEIYRDILRSKAYIQKIHSVFPEVVKEVEIDRKALASVVFSNDQAREQLNSIAHPMIMEKLLSEMNSTNSSLVFAEVPLLFEGKFENNFDCILVIMRSKNARLNAVQEREKCTKEEVLARMQVQFAYDTEEDQNHMRSCNAILIENNATKKELFKKLDEQIQLWKEDVKLFV